MHPPMAEGAPWIVERHGGNPLRVSADVGALLSELDGDRDAGALAVALGERWTPALVTEALTKFGGLGLLHVPGTPPPRPERRFVAHSWTVLQLRLVRATQVLAPVRPLLIRLSGRAVSLAVAAVFAAGVVALAVQHAAVGEALGRPLPMGAVVAIWLGLGASTVVHELGHGATLTHFRGNPGWFGIMLFYLTPACFCEVTDGWRLAKPRQRVVVALAGVATQAVIGSVAALLALALPAGDGRVALIGFALSTFVAAALNLAPWVKLDGYLALMSALDTPLLREKAMADARNWLSRLLFGLPSRRRLPGRRWVVPYGLLCLVFPAVVLTLAIGRWGQELRGLGPAGSVIRLLLVAFLVCWLARRAYLGLRDARRAGARLGRMAGAVALIAAVLALPLGLVRLPENVRAGYVRDADGVHLVVPTGADLGPVHAGDPVVLQRKGLLLTTRLGTAEVGAGAPVPARVPAGALLPFRSAGTADAVLVPLTDVRGTGFDETGSAVLPGASRPLAAWLVREQVTSVWQDIFGG
ncbi:hypothetical protein GCM10023214_09290 [Amycolatopsis dongchuanensis]|uniref:Peptide zinc metalloprotease protein n=2 Tax=Amycolatopsis TaxID=1813 RepID=A0ABP9PZ80_9PSEU|nr:putative peptide zinc metalloprotease protein [Amycolatopsis sacchari]